MYIDTSRIGVCIIQACLYFFASEIVMIPKGSKAEHAKPLNSLKLSFVNFGGMSSHFYLLNVFP